MINVHVLDVFTDSNGEFGDKVTVIIDESRRISDADRQELTKKLNTVETVFVNNVKSADISIMHTQGETDFAGVAALGAAKLLSNLEDKPIKKMKGRGGDIIVTHEDELTWARADLATMPPWHHKQLDDADEVERIKLEETGAWEHIMIWAWIDEAKGLVRARTFATDWDIPEAEGNGSGSMLLAALLDREIEIKHGKGAVIFAKPAPNKYADIGGRVTEGNIIHV